MITLVLAGRRTGERQRFQSRPSRRRGRGPSSANGTFTAAGHRTGAWSDSVAARTAEGTARSLSECGPSRGGGPEGVRSHTRGSTWSDSGPGQTAQGAPARPVSAAGCPIHQSALDPGLGVTEYLIDLIHHSRKCLAETRECRPARTAQEHPLAHTVRTG